jgi:hypothetical protein
LAALPSEKQQKQDDIDLWKLYNYLFDDSDGVAAQKQAERDLRELNAEEERLLELRVRLLQAREQIAIGDYMEQFLPLTLEGYQRAIDYWKSRGTGDPGELETEPRKVYQPNNIKTEPYRLPDTYGKVPDGDPLYQWNWFMNRYRRDYNPAKPPEPPKPPSGRPR